MFWIIFVVVRANPVWYWTNDQGKLQPYAPGQQTSIEAAYQSKRNSFFDLGNQEIFFASITEKTEKEIREVRKIDNLWYWRSGQKEFELYDDFSQNRIDKAYQNLLFERISLGDNYIWFDRKMIQKRKVHARKLRDVVREGGGLTLFPKKVENPETYFYDKDLDTTERLMDEALNVPSQVFAHLSNCTNWSLLGTWLAHEFQGNFDYHFFAQAANIANEKYGSEPRRLIKHVLGQMDKKSNRKEGSMYSALCDKYPSLKVHRKN